MIDADNFLPFLLYLLLLSPFLFINQSLLRSLAFAVLLPHGIARFVYRKKGGKTHLEDGRRLAVTDLSLSRMAHSFATEATASQPRKPRLTATTIRRVVNCDTESREDGRETITQRARRCRQGTMTRAKSLNAGNARASLALSLAGPTIFVLKSSPR